MKRVAVIMAGGAGERFWPLSRANYPKQLLKIAGSRSMLEAAVERIAPLIPPEDVYIITGQALKPAIEREIRTVPAHNIVAEPSGKNTAACLALASAYLKARYDDADVTTVVMTADHYIQDTRAFCYDCEAAMVYAEQNPSLVTFGMVPDRPETGYGYIELGEPAIYAPDPGFIHTHPPGTPAGGTDPTAPDIRAKISKVASFREKPGPEMAAEFLASGRFLWNSGMFVWRNSTIQQAFREHLHATGIGLEPLQAAIKAANLKSQDSELLAPVFNTFEKISIDVGIMERAHNVAVVRASFDWDDIGTWGSLQRLLGHDTTGNVVYGQGMAISCHDTVIYSIDTQPGTEPASPNNPSETPRQRQVVVAYGLRDTVIVTTPDAVLVLPADKVQGVKDVVTYLRQNGLGKYL